MGHRVIRNAALWLATTLQLSCRDRNSPFRPANRLQALRVCCREVCDCCRPGIAGCNRQKLQRVAGPLLTPAKEKPHCHLQPSCCCRSGVRWRAWAATQERSSARWPTRRRRGWSCWGQGAWAPSAALCWAASVTTSCTTLTSPSWCASRSTTTTSTATEHPRRLCVGCFWASSYSSYVETK